MSQLEKDLFLGPPLRDIAPLWLGELIDPFYSPHSKTIELPEIPSHLINRERLFFGYFVSEAITQRILDAPEYHVKHFDQVMEITEYCLFQIVAWLVIGLKTRCKPFRRGDNGRHSADMVYFAMYESGNKTVEVLGGTKRVPSNETLEKIGLMDRLGVEPRWFDASNPEGTQVS